MRLFEYACLNDFAVTALTSEVLLSPKPGLVDRLNNGAHFDMDVELFMKSAEVISTYMANFASIGWENRYLPANMLLPIIREVGLQCEIDMFNVTHGVNTHKGAIFSFALISAAMGKHWDHITEISIHDLCNEVATICAGIVRNELKNSDEQNTAGQKIFKKHGIAGARGEAEKGFQSVRLIALPILDRLWGQYSEEKIYLHILMNLVAYTNDTNIISRKGIQGLVFAQDIAKHYLNSGSVFNDQDLMRLKGIDNLFILNNISPGGCADLLAITLYLKSFKAWQMKRGHLDET